MLEAIEMLARHTQGTKGDTLGLSALILSVIQSMPESQKEAVFAEYSKQIRTLNTILPTTQEGLITLSELKAFDRVIRQYVINT